MIFSKFVIPMFNFDEHVSELIFSRCFQKMMKNTDIRRSDWFDNVCGHFMKFQISETEMFLPNKLFIIHLIFRFASLVATHGSSLCTPSGSSGMRRMRKPAFCGPSSRCRTLLFSYVFSPFRKLGNAPYELAVFHNHIGIFAVAGGI